MDTRNKSLEDINSSIALPKTKNFWKLLFSYLGPGALVAVGYMDPGNWATSITGGQYFQYHLLSIILLSSLIAMVLQYASMKLGIVTCLDLAQVTRKYTTKRLSVVLWIVAELAIMATDIAEVIGAAIALKLLFHIPLLFAVFITIFDVFLLLLLTKIGFRKIEALVVCLIAVIFLVFSYQIYLSDFQFGEALKGMVPSLYTVQDHPVIGGTSPLACSLGIIGATIMPHNLYLHSSISQVRKIDGDHSTKEMIKFSTIDSNLQLGMAFIVNALLLFMGAAVFKGNAIQDTSFFGIYDALQNPALISNPIMSNISKTGILSTLFAVALLASGQNSTITGTLTGQIIMEGFVHIKLPPWLRRLVTRLLAVLPVMICILFTHHMSTAQQHLTINNLMIDSQIFLSLALPFSIIPLLMITNNKRIMGEFANRLWIKVIGWVSTIVLVYLNLTSIEGQIASICHDFEIPANDTVIQIISFTLCAVILLLLFRVAWDMHKRMKKIHPE